MCLKKKKDRKIREKTQMKKIQKQKRDYNKRNH